MGKVNLKFIIPVIVIAAIFAVAPFGLPRFYVYLIALIVTTGLLSTSLNFVLGFGGIYQFHHAVFYGAGAYAAAVMIMKLEYNPWIGFVVGPLVAAFLSLVIGLICIRLSKLYFGMLQISLGSLVWVIVYRWYSLTGGDDGIHGISVPAILESPIAAYYFTLIVAARLIVHHVPDSPRTVREYSSGDSGQRGTKPGDRRECKTTSAHRDRDCRILCRRRRRSFRRGRQFGFPGYDVLDPFARDHDHGPPGGLVSLFWDRCSARP